MKKFLNTILQLFFFCSILQAQQTTYKRLEIGDTVPNLKLHYLQNGKPETINMRELKGKLVILDFWNIWCSSCIAAMPHMAGLQKQFPDEVRIFLVTNNNQAQVDGQFKAIASRAKSHNSVLQIPGSLGSIVSDTELHQLFPHRAVPHHIWIGKDGTVKYIASGTDATSDRIKGVLKGENVNIVVKKDTGTFNTNIPLYQNGANQLKNLKFYSMVYKEAGEYQNTAKRESLDTLEGTYRFRCLNFTPVDLYRETTLASNGQKYFKANRLILEVRDSTKLFWPKDFSQNASWREKNLICYDLAVPITKKRFRDQIMLDDLNRFLPYYGRIEKRILTCLALVNTGKNERFRADTTAIRFVRERGSSIDIQNASMGDLVSRGLSFVVLNSKIPVIDDTGYKGNVSVYLSSRNDREQLLKELRLYGFDLVEKKLEVDMLVISDR